MRSVILQTIYNPNEKSVSPLKYETFEKHSFLDQLPIKGKLSMLGKDMNRANKFDQKLTLTDDQSDDNEMKNIRSSSFTFTPKVDFQYKYGNKGKLKGLLGENNLQGSDVQLLDQLLGIDKQPKKNVQFAELLKKETSTKFEKQDQRKKENQSKTNEF